MSTEERRHPDNGIWLCQTHAKLIDDDTEGFSVGMLHDWKSAAENYARENIGKPPLRTRREILAESAIKSFLGILGIDDSPPNDWDALLRKAATAVRQEGTKTLEPSATSPFLIQDRGLDEQIFVILAYINEYAGAIGTLLEIDERGLERSVFAGRSALRQIDPDPIHFASAFLCSFISEHVIASNLPKDIVGALCDIPNHANVIVGFAIVCDFLGIRGIRQNQYAMLIDALSTITLTSHLKVVVCLLDSLLADSNEIALDD